MNSTEQVQPLILFRDRHLVALDKPCGIPVQPDLTGDPCLLNQVQAMFPSCAVGSPHRLDRPVSGVTLFTLGDEALKAMNALFRERRVAKTYLAIVEGRIEAQGELHHHIGHRGGSRKADITEVKEPAQANASLRFSVRATGNRFTLLEVVPSGGAFHQIRAQLAASGHPIKGDVKYGARRGEPDRSIALHAWRMEFEHPFTGVKTAVEAPLPARSIWPALLAL